MLEALDRWMPDLSGDGLAEFWTLVSIGATNPLFLGLGLALLACLLVWLFGGFVADAEPEAESAPRRVDAEKAGVEEDGSGAEVCGRSLNLARAYMEIPDRRAEARRLLRRVLESGDADSRVQAQALLGRMAGD